MDANKNITLTVKKNINLTSATKNSKSESKSRSFWVGIGTDDFSANGSVNPGKGFEKGNSQFYTDSEVNSGKQLTLHSGKGTDLTGGKPVVKVLKRMLTAI
ncbi:hemagglutinin repeat-containing protein [Providencia stuartii]|nr:MULTISPECIES: hemagglutinin repeat-containing protein [Providencia]MDN0010685.1 hemagglutinin repeat-containing protein [Providencia stuartii]